ncbi:MAG: diguanylate cyclase [Bacillota bacterium]|nr:diguanylate cyclase [Bacillota bacterium]
MKKNSKTISIRTAIISVFVISILLMAGGIGSMIFINWHTSIDVATKDFSQRISDNIYERINTLIHIPDHINEVNYKVIDSGLLDIADDQKRDAFFVGVLSAQPSEIYSFSFGTASGEYYGARRNEAGQIEIMRNDARTGGYSWYYSVKDDMTAGERVVQAGLFDARTRDWYQAAVRDGGPTLSPVYKHFIMDDLTISAAWPIYDENGDLEGVLGAHMLLSGVGAYLADMLQAYQGFALIFEKDSGAFIANSLAMPNFLLQDGKLQRTVIHEIDNTDIRQAYAEYQQNQNPYFLHTGENGKLYVNVQEIHMPGIDWIIISAIPHSLLMTRVDLIINWTVILVVLFIIILIFTYDGVTRKLFKPIDDLLQVSESLAAGDLATRVAIIRNDEIGIISQGVNKVADKMQYLINNLEESVKDRTDELFQTNMALAESKDQLQLILDSTAEAIYGIDLNGNCTFCNSSCIKLLGYDDQTALLGNNMHEQLHHSHRDGSLFPTSECKIIQSIRSGKGFTTDDEVFWKSDGSSFDVTYQAYPQVKSGVVIGGVITFSDITDRKKKEEEIRYLSCHDILTGLHNRRCFEENLPQIDTPDHLPLSVIFADINGLKMTNDIFGHAAGDALIRKSSEILKQSCRENDAIARVGGDEFIIVLPNTSREHAQEIQSRIRSGFADARVAAIKCSIALGADTKTSAEQSLEEVMANAENAMYKDKTINRKTVNKNIIETILETLHARLNNEMAHSNAVSEVCAKIGAALKLAEPEIVKLKRAAYLHDIGKITLSDKVLTSETLTDDEMAEMQHHPIVGYRILNLFDDTLDLAEYIYSHHERWDGSGYPRGLKGEQIPQLSRIISIAETYDRVISRGERSISERKAAALSAIKEGAGTQFDPVLAACFVKLMEEDDC